MIRRTLTVVNRLGLHARAASKLVNCASGYDAEVWLRRGEREVNGKSIMGVLTLAAGQGTPLEVRAEGSDEEAAIGALEELFSSRFGEDA